MWPRHVAVDVSQVPVEHPQAPVDRWQGPPGASVVAEPRAGGTEVY
jgi:hypothetical protein